VPLMTAVRSEEDVTRQNRVTAEIVAFVERVCNANVLLDQAAFRHEPLVRFPAVGLRAIGSVSSCDDVV
jgi:hypothetical protein